MTPPKPPRKSYMMTSTVTSSYEVIQSVCKDPDASQPDVKDGSQSEVKVKPVPRPRSKIKPNVECNASNNTLDSVGQTSDTNNAVDSQPNPYTTDYERPQPARPPPRPPLCKQLTSRKPPKAVDEGSCYMNINTEKTVPPDASAKRKESLRPERPPLPSIYYDRLQLKPKSETCTGGQHSRNSSISSMDESPSLCETYSSTATDCTDRPAVPPRLGQSSFLDSASVYEPSPPQTRVPPPSFKPPPPPPSEGIPESVYSEIEYRPYLDILPEDDEDMMSLGGSTLCFGHYQSGSHSSQKTTDDTEDINGLLRWLKRVSKPDSMAPSLYGLSIEEEIRSFNQRGMNVRKALRLYNLLMMKRNESLRNTITEFTAISDNLDKMQKKTKTMGIAGGTTGAVGGMTAVLGIALAPVTMGSSLIATAVGAGMVASAGGLGAHAAKANKKVVNRMGVEKLVYDYKSNVVDLEYCLDFILSGMNELRRHDIARIQRAGAQTDALKMAHLSQSVIRNDKAPGTHTGAMSAERLLRAFAKEIDQYFTEKDGQKLKKSNKSRFSGRVRLLAKNLQEDLDHLNCMWEMFS